MAEDPKPTTPDELLAVIRDACAMDVPADFDPESPGRAVLQSGYEQSAQALVTCALAAFEFAAREVGATGFQASWALLQVLWRGNRWDGPGIVLRADDLLYPQYPPAAKKAAEWKNSDEVRRWLRTRARELLEVDRGFVVQRVRDHWMDLASMNVPEEADRV